MAVVVAGYTIVDSDDRQMQQGVRLRIRGLTQCSPHSGEEYNTGGNDTSSVPGAGERDVASVQPTLSLGAMPFGCERTQFHVQHLVDRMVKVSAARTLFYRFTRTPKISCRLRRASASTPS